MRIRIQTLLATMLMVLGFIIYAAPAQALAQTACSPTCYVYAGAKQTVTNLGAGVRISKETPVLSGARHSLAELVVETTNGAQVVEVGWIVDPVVNGDSVPHLFVFNWVGGVPGCYNACGWLNAAGCSPCAGASLASVPDGTTKQFGIQYIPGASVPGWWVSYDGSFIGVFPSTDWTGAGQTFTSAGLVQAFGEVAEPLTAPDEHGDMGNGVLATGLPTALGGKISSLSLVSGGAAAGWGTFFATTPSKWNVASLSTPTAPTTAFRFGGPGY
jgi:hypothetical protein